jgi:hypothetical protein
LNLEHATDDEIAGKKTEKNSQCHTVDYHNRLIIAETCLPVQWISSNVIFMRISDEKQQYIAGKGESPLREMTTQNQSLNSF